jgi:hypothetical protein
LSVIAEGLEGEVFRDTQDEGVWTGLVYIPAHLTRSVLPGNTYRLDAGAGLSIMIVIGALHECSRLHENCYGFEALGHVPSDHFCRWD